MITFTNISGLILPLAYAEGKKNTSECQRHISICALTSSVCSSNVPSTFFFGSNLLHHMKESLNMGQHVWARCKPCVIQTAKHVLSLTTEH